MASQREKESPWVHEQGLESMLSMPRARENHQIQQGGDTLKNAHFSCFDGELGLACMSGESGLCVA